MTLLTEIPRSYFLEFCLKRSQTLPMLVALQRKKKVKSNIVEKMLPTQECVHWTFYLKVLFLFFLNWWQINFLFLFLVVVFKEFHDGILFVFGRWFIKGVLLVVGELIGLFKKKNYWNGGRFFFSSLFSKNFWI